MFKAIVIDKKDDAYTCQYQELDEGQFPFGNVTVNVEYSTLNYKDGLAISGSSPVVRSFPMVPGIDFSGVVEQSDDPKWQPGQRVFTNGWGLGEKFWGGLAQKARVNGDWLLPLPEGMDNYSVMAVGTAGYTAMLAVQAIIKHGISPAHGPVLVTGANGGVGSFAIAFLARLGYRVIASTGRLNESDRLKELGAIEVIDRTTLSEESRPLNKERWAAAIDSAGSTTLANVCASTQYGGIVAACGLAQGMDFPATVAPFILRGITLVGIDSVMCPLDRRREVWGKIAEIIDEKLVSLVCQLISFEQAIEQAQHFLKGEVKGRIVVNMVQQ